MLNQSFSADNFRRILDLENRNGVYLEGQFFTNMNTITEDIRQCNKDIREKRRLKPRPTDELKALYEKRRELKKRKEEQLIAELQKVSDKVVASDFVIRFDKKDIPNAKSLYVTKNSPEYYFTMKQLQSNLSRLFVVKQANRFEIVNQVKVLLSDKFPKYIIRTDIDDFFENIPHGPLLERICDNNLMTPFSKKILIQILNEYKSLSGSDKGIPRGIGISANLAELYMRDIDKEIMSLPGVSYYARYVDDIIIIFTPSFIDQRRKYLNEIKKIVERFQLRLNDKKTHKFNCQKSNKKYKYRLDYLGYKVFFGEDEASSEKKYSFYVSANKLITRFKTIIKEAGIAYKDILNYTLACIDRKTLKLIKIYSNIEDKEKYEKKVTEAVLELLDFTFFLYCVSPKVNTTIKLCLILSKLIKFAKLKGNFNHDNKHRIFKEIYDGISLVLWKNKHSEYMQVETLYLLIALKELGQKYRLSENVICKYFNLNINAKRNKHNFNYFSISVLLFYVGNKVRYSEIRNILKKIIRYKFKNISKDNRFKMAELILLFFDLLACPYLDVDFKKELLIYYDIIVPAEQNAILSRQGYWFTQWDDFDFGKELEAKKSQEVY